MITFLRGSNAKEDDDSRLHKRSAEEPTIIIIPGNLRNYIENEKGKNKKKKTRFLNDEDVEFSSEVSVCNLTKNNVDFHPPFQWLVETGGIEKEFRSEHLQDSLVHQTSVKRRLSY